jgi:hypothetical protein
VLGPGGGRDGRVDISLLSDNVMASPGGLIEFGQDFICTPTNASLAEMYLDGNEAHTGTVRNLANWAQLP